MPLSVENRLISAGEKQPGLLHLPRNTIDVRSSLVCPYPLHTQGDKTPIFGYRQYALLCGAAQHSQWGLIVLVKSAV